ncbi:hypothetical protein B9S64_09730 [Streptomyces sp. SM18]|nr:hypothetical protein B9S64_09730 [Streptomyces sp. SM18]
MRSHAPDAAGPALRADGATFETPPSPVHARRRVPLRRRRSTRFSQGTPSSGRVSGPVMCGLRNTSVESITPGAGAWGGNLPGQTVNTGFPRGERR